MQQEEKVFQDTFNVPPCSGNIIYFNRNYLKVEGVIEDVVEKGMITYYAANPMDRMSSFSGSGLPFMNYQQAFENTPNKNTIELGLNNSFTIDLAMPNSYYVGLGTVLIPPTLFIEYKNGEGKSVLPIKINNPVPYRTLTYPMSQNHISRQNAMFYNTMKDLPVRTQEQILRDSAYPEMNNSQPTHAALPVNFWGAKPPV